MLQDETRTLGRAWLRRHQGGPMPIELRLTSLRGSFHLDRHFLLTCIDQTDALERENQSRLLDSVLENSEAAIYAFDTTGRTLLANPTTRRLFRNGEDDDPIGQFRSELVPQEYEDLYAKHDLEVFRKRQPILCEETLKQADGTLHHFVSQKFPIIDQKGNVIAVGGVSNEVTALKTMNARWELAAKVFENGSESIIVTDSEQRITMVNRCFTETTGYAEEEIIGSTPQLLASGEHDAHFFRDMFQTIHTVGYWEGEIWNRRKQGDVYPEWMRIAEVRDANGLLQHYVSISRDISQQKSAQEQINSLAFYDPLTGLPNRELLRDRTQQVIAQAHRDQSSFALCFLDLDQFKQVNDSLGHSIGDQLLIEIARRLRRQLREQDTISRIGGDEFVLVLPKVDPDTAGTRLLKVLRPSSSRWNWARTRSRCRTQWASPCIRLTVKRLMICSAHPTPPCIKPKMPGATVNASSAARWGSGPFAGWRSKWRWIRPSPTMNSSFITSLASCSDKTAWQASRPCCAGTVKASGPSDPVNSSR